MISNIAQTSVGLACQKAAFDIPDAITYLNCAYMSPLMHEVAEAGVQGLLAKKRPYEIVADDFFLPLEKLKATFSQLIDNDDPQRIAFQPSVSYGIATIAQNLPLKPKGNIVLVEGQFPSDVLVFRSLASQHGLKIHYVAAPDDFEQRTEKWNAALLQHIDNDTIAIICPHVHWADGTIFDLVQIAEVARQNEAVFVVDGTQSVGALPFSIKDIKPDALICAGYKFLMGPYSCALSYFGPIFDGGEPLEHNWIARKDSNKFGGLVNYQDAFREKAFRYNVGECSNFIAIPMLQVALEQILAWGVEHIQQYCSRLISPYLSEIRNLGYRLAETGRANHLFGIYLSPGQSIEVIGAELASKQIFVSQRGPSIRISPHVYNDSSDLDKLLEAL